MTYFNILSIISVLVYFVIYNYRNNISNYLKITDQPDGLRKIHKKPTPKTGSFSIALIFMFIMIFNLFYKFIDSNFNYILFGSLFVFIAGFLDDKFKLSASIKIILLSLAIIILFFQTDIFIIKKFYIYSLDFFFNLNFFSYIFTLSCFLVLTNALNLADGINGLATGIIFFWLIYLSQLFDSDLGLIINLILVHLILIFFHNYKGHHFLGDSGSLMLSAFVALLTIYLYNLNIDNPNKYNSSEIILILFIIPILDMIRLFFERIINKKSPAFADNNHLHHYLMKQFSERKALFIYLISINIPIIFIIKFNFSLILTLVSVILIYFSYIFIYKTRLKNYE